MSLTTTGWVEPPDMPALISELREAVDDARRETAAVEARNAAALALHWSVTVGPATGYCCTCDYLWPCPTYVALGGNTP